MPSRGFTRAFPGRRVVHPAAGAQLKQRLGTLC
jgi:hypothetical protein